MKKLVAVAVLAYCLLLTPGSSYGQFSPPAVGAASTVPYSGITGLTANEPLYGGAAGAPSQSPNFTFDGSTLSNLGTLGTSLVIGGTSWATTGSGWTASGTSVAMSGTGTTQTAQPTPSIAPVVGQLYLISFTYSYTAGTARISFGGILSNVNLNTSSGSVSFYVVASSTANLIFTAGTSGTQTWTVSAVNVQPVNGGTIIAGNNVSLTNGWLGIGTAAPTASLDIEQSNALLNSSLFKALNNHPVYGGGISFGSNSAIGSLNFLNASGASVAQILSSTGGWQFNTSFNVNGSSVWPTTGVLGWGASFSADTGLSRDSAGVVDFGTGAQGSSAGSWKATTGNFTGSSFTFNGHTCTIVSTVVTCP